MTRHKVGKSIQLIGLLYMSFVTIISRYCIGIFTQSNITTTLLPGVILIFIGLLLIKIDNKKND